MRESFVERLSRNLQETQTLLRAQIDSLSGLTLILVDEAYDNVYVKVLTREEGSTSWSMEFRVFDWLVRKHKAGNRCLLIIAYKTFRLMEFNPKQWSHKLSGGGTWFHKLDHSFVEELPSLGVPCSCQS